jgi:hypothetical protein
VTLPSPPTLAPTDRFRRLEDPGTDFPFYNGHPVALTGGQWVFVMAAVVAGFLVIVLPIPWPAGALGALLPALLFAVVPLAALARVAPGHWKRLFGRVGLREIRLMLGFALLNLVVTFAVGALVRAVAEVTPNAAAGLLSAMDTAERVVFFAKMLPQLLGEELLTLLPFLALMAVLPRWTGVGRKGAIVGAWLISSLLFGLLHLPTYDWNLVQCVVVIGTARLVLTLPWILTKNIWVCTGAHVINDWLLLGLSLAGAGLVARA